MTLWKLQALIVVAMLLVGLAAANFGTMRATPKMQEMCRAQSDATARALCAEFNAD